MSFVAFSSFLDLENLTNPGSFEGLMSVDKDLALEVFRNNQGFYHPTCLRLMRGVLDKNGLKLE